MGVPSGRVALVACGAIAQPAADAVARRAWPVDVHPLPPLLHNRPERIADAVEALVLQLRGRYDRVVVGYADCGSYGALDAVCQRLHVDRLPGLHCYDLFAGSDVVSRLSEDEPGTYLLTDFLVKSFARTVIQELGLAGIPNCVMTTSATTPGSCGWCRRRIRWSGPSCAPWRRPRPTASGCRSR